MGWIAVIIVFWCFIIVCGVYDNDEFSSQAYKPSKPEDTQDAPDAAPTHVDKKVV
jgi:hypothetical protein